MLVYLRDRSAQTILCAATLRQKLQIKLSTSPSHSMLTPGWPIPVLTLWRQASVRVAIGVPIFKSLVWLDPEKFCQKRNSNPGSTIFVEDALTARPTRRSSLQVLSNTLAFDMQVGRTTANRTDVKDCLHRYICFSHGSEIHVET